MDHLNSFNDYQFFYAATSQQTKCHQQDNVQNDMLEENSYNQIDDLFCNVNKQIQTNHEQTSNLKKQGFTDLHIQKYSQNYSYNNMHNNNYNSIFQENEQQQSPIHQKSLEQIQITSYPQSASNQINFPQQIQKFSQKCNYNNVNNQIQTINNQNEYNYNIHPFLQNNDFLNNQKSESLLSQIENEQNNLQLNQNIQQKEKNFTQEMQQQQYNFQNSSTTTNNEIQEKNKNIKNEKYSQIQLDFQSQNEIQQQNQSIYHNEHINQKSNQDSNKGNYLELHFLQQGQISQNFKRLLTKLPSQNIQKLIHQQEEEFYEKQYKKLHNELLIKEESEHLLSQQELKHFQFQQSINHYQLDNDNNNISNINNQALNDYIHISDQFQYQNQENENEFQNYRQININKSNNMVLSNTQQKQIIQQEKFLAINYQESQNLFLNQDKKFPIFNLNHVCQSQENQKFHEQNQSNFNFNNDNNNNKDKQKIPSQDFYKLQNSKKYLQQQNKKQKSSSNLYQQQQLLKQNINQTNLNLDFLQNLQPDQITFPIITQSWLDQQITDIQQEQFFYLENFQKNNEIQLQNIQYSELKKGKNQNISCNSKFQDNNFDYQQYGPNQGQNQEKSNNQLILNTVQKQSNNISDDSKVLNLNNNNSNFTDEEDNSLQNQTYFNCNQRKIQKQHSQSFQSEMNTTILSQNQASNIMTTYVNQNHLNEVSQSQQNKENFNSYQIMSLTQENQTQNKNNNEELSTIYNINSYDEQVESIGGSDTLDNSGKSKSSTQCQTNLEMKKSEQEQQQMNQSQIYSQQQDPFQNQQNHINSQQKIEEENFSQKQLYVKKNGARSKGNQNLNPFSPKQLSFAMQFSQDINRHVILKTLDPSLKFEQRKQIYKQLREKMGNKQFQNTEQSVRMFQMMIKNLVKTQKQLLIIIMKLKKIVEVPSSKNNVREVGKRIAGFIGLELLIQLIYKDSNLLSNFSSNDFNLEAKLEFDNLFDLEMDYKNQFIDYLVPCHVYKNRIELDKKQLKNIMCVDKKQVQKKRKLVQQQ